MNAVLPSYPASPFIAPRSSPPNLPNGSALARHRSGRKASGALSERDIDTSKRCAFRLAFRITHVKEDAEDVQQEALLKAYTHLGQFEGRSRFTTWISRIAINEALMCLRKRRDALHAPLEEFVNPDESSSVKTTLSSPYESPEAAYARKELREILKNALNQLSPIYRDVFVMRVLEDMSTTETAQIGRLSVSAVKTRMRRARIQLREILRRSNSEQLAPSRV